MKYIYKIKPLSPNLQNKISYLSVGGLISRSSLSMEAEMALKLSWSSPRLGLSSQEGVSRTTPDFTDEGILVESLQFKI